MSKSDRPNESTSSHLVGLEEAFAPPNLVPEPSPGQGFSPRLGIQHLMIWMTVTAILFWQSQLTLQTQVAGRSMDLPDGIRTMQLATFVISSVVGGAIAAGLWALIRGWQQSGPRGKRQKLLRQPGHWLALSFGVATLIRFLIGIASQGLPAITSEIQWQQYLFVLFVLPTSIVLVVAVVRTEERLWRVLFALMSIVLLLTMINYGLLINQTFATYGSVFGSVFERLNQFTQVAGIALPLLIIVLALAEKFRGRDRDWIHWTGIAAEGIAILSSLIWLVGSALLN